MYLSRQMFPRRMIVRSNLDDNLHPGGSSEVSKKLSGGSPHSSLRAIRHETSGLGTQTIYRGRRCDVERPVVVVSPGEVGWLFRHLDRAQVVALRVPYPDSSWASNKQVAVAVNFYAVGHALMRSTGFLAKDSIIV